jgi:hypothetical protein
MQISKIWKTHSSFLYGIHTTQIANSENLKINLKIILFVDDTSVIISNPTITDLEQNFEFGV